MCAVDQNCVLHGWYFGGPICDSFLGFCNVVLNFFKGIMLMFLVWRSFCIFFVLLAMAAQKTEKIFSTFFNSTVGPM